MIIIMVIKFNSFGETKKGLIEKKWRKMGPKWN
jgi:hypothetical protein